MNFDLYGFIMSNLLKQKTIVKSFSKSSKKFSYYEYKYLVLNHDLPQIKNILKVANFAKLFKVE